jgi:hypothetical protein
MSSQKQDFHQEQKNFCVVLNIFFDDAFVPKNPYHWRWTNPLFLP